MVKRNFNKKLTIALGALIGGAESLNSATVSAMEKKQSNRDVTYCKVWFDLNDQTRAQVNRSHFNRELKRIKEYSEGKLPSITKGKWWEEITNILTSTQMYLVNWQNATGVLHGAPGNMDRSGLLKLIKKSGTQLLAYANMHVQTKEDLKAIRPAIDCLSLAADLLDECTEHVGPWMKRTSIEKIKTAAGCLVWAANSDTDEDFTRRISYFKKEKIFGVIEEYEYNLDKIDQYIENRSVL